MFSLMPFSHSCSSVCLSVSPFPLPFVFYSLSLFFFCCFLIKVIDISEEDPATLITTPSLLHDTIPNCPFFDTSPKKKFTPRKRCSYESMVVCYIPLVHVCVRILWDICSKQKGIVYAVLL